MGRVTEFEPTGNLDHDLALVLTQHHRINEPSGDCICGSGVGLGELFTKHLVEVIREAGWKPRAE